MMVRLPDHHGRSVMPKSIAPALCVFAALVSTSALAQSAPAFEKKNYNYAEWAKGRFSEVVTATGPAKMIFLAGVGAEDENGKPGDRHCHVDEQ
jgi:2-iminobutanoate/2-iminopropanoate deaminase